MHSILPMQCNCGGAPEIVRNGIGDYYVECTSCKIASDQRNCEDADHAIKRWNKMQSVPPPPQVNYANEPKTVTTLRAEKESDASKWTPRDALIDALRRLDSGLIAPTSLIVMFDDSVNKQIGWSVSAQDKFLTLGLMTRCMHKYQSTLDGD